MWWRDDGNASPLIEEEALSLEYVLFGGWMSSIIYGKTGHMLAVIYDWVTSSIDQRDLAAMVLAYKAKQAYVAGDEAKLWCLGLCSPDEDGFRLSHANITTTCCFMYLVPHYFDRCRVNMLSSTPPYVTSTVITNSFQACRQWLRHELMGLLTFGYHGWKLTISFSSVIPLVHLHSRFHSASKAIFKVSTQLCNTKRP